MANEQLSACINSRFTQFKLLGAFLSLSVKVSLLKLLSGTGTKADVACHLLLTVCVWPLLWEGLCSSLGEQFPAFRHAVAVQGHVGFAGCSRHTQPPPKNLLLQGSAAAAAGCPMLVGTSPVALQAAVGREGPHKGNSNGSRPPRVCPQDLVTLALTSICPPCLLVSP